MISAWVNEATDLQLVLPSNVIHHVSSVSPWHVLLNMQQQLDPEGVGFGSIVECFSCNWCLQKKFLQIVSRTTDWYYLCVSLFGEPKRKGWSFAI